MTPFFVCLPFRQEQEAVDDTGQQQERNKKHDVYFYVQLQLLLVNSYSYFDLYLLNILVDRAGGDDERRFGVPTRSLPHGNRGRDPRRRRPLRV